MWSTRYWSILVWTYRAKEEAKRRQELMENREKEQKEIQRQEVELIKEVYVSSAVSAYSNFKTLAYGVVM